MMHHELTSCAMPTGKKTHSTKRIYKATRFNMNTDTTFACNSCPCDVRIIHGNSIIELFNRLKFHQSAYYINRNDIGVFFKGKSSTIVFLGFTYMHISKFIVLDKSTSMSKEYMNCHGGIAKLLYKLLSNVEFPPPSFKLQFNISTFI